MGIPIDFSYSSPPSNFTPGHSAKPSLTSGASVSNISNSQLSSSRTNQDISNSPSSSFSYIPPPPSNWGYTARSPQPTQSPLSIHSPPSLSPPPHSYSPNLLTSRDRYHQQQNNYPELLDNLDSSSIASGFTDVEIESPLTTWARPHPNIRRTSRAPEFSNNSNISLGVDQWESSSLSSSSISSISPPQSDFGNYNPNWETNLSSTREYYLNRPLPIPPPPRISRSSLSSTTATLGNNQHSQGREYINSISMNSYEANGYFYEDHRLRNEQNFLLQQPPSYQQRQRLYRNPNYNPSTNSVSSYLSESQNRGRLGNTEIQILTSTTSINPSSSSSSSSTSFSSSIPSPSLSPSSAQSPIATAAIPSFLQGTTGSSRTIVRAHPFRPGMIRIYPENHEPITMYGRPILTPTSPSPTNYGYDLTRNQSSHDATNNRSNHREALEVPGFSELGNTASHLTPPTSSSSSISTITLGTGSTLSSPSTGNSALIETSSSALL